MIFTPPIHFNRGEILNFLAGASFIFKCKGKKEKDFTLNLSPIKDISLLGQLLIYKFISFTARNACFIGPSINWNSNQVIYKQFVKSGFLKIMTSYVENPKDWDDILKSYEGLHTISHGTYFFAPHSLIRDDIDKRNNVEQEFLNSISDFYKSNGNKVSIVSMCISELIMNFWSHATDDSDTVLVAKGGDQYFELIFADNAQGIITTLKDGNTEFSRMKPTEILKKSCEAGVSSKQNTYHQGYGLYLVSQLAKSNEGQLNIFSEGVGLKITESGLEAFNTGYWKGTIIELRLKLKKPKAISEIVLTKIDDRFKWREV
jgi:Signal transduction histidine kinase regulating citrate/malate metabolism